MAFDPDPKILGRIHVFISGPAYHAYSGHIFNTLHLKVLWLLIFLSESFKSLDLVHFKRHTLRILSLDGFLETDAI